MCVHTFSYRTKYFAIYGNIKFAACVIRGNCTKRSFVEPHFFHVVSKHNENLIKEKKGEGVSNRISAGDRAISQPFHMFLRGERGG